jgi:hypothetical protein
MLVFLDIDGVMVPAKGWKAPELLQDGFSMFSNKATSALRNLIAEDDTIILTTSHKSNYTVDEWIDIFSTRGINIKNVECLPTNLNHLSRKDEIMNWFSTNTPSEDFIIIDDDKSLNDLPSSLKEYLVQPFSHIGLTEELLQNVKVTA